MNSVALFESLAASGRRRPVAVSLTPLIDVVFILLLFFMLTTSFARYHSLDFNISGGAAAAPSIVAEAPVVVEVLPGDRWRLQEQEYRRQDQTFELVLEELLQRDARVLVSAGDGLTLQGLVSGIEHLQQSGLQKLDLIPSRDRGAANAD